MACFKHYSLSGQPDFSVSCFVLQLRTSIFILRADLLTAADVEDFTTQTMSVSVLISRCIELMHIGVVLWLCRNIFYLMHTELI